jgi:hypothetical protein
MQAHAPKMNPNAEKGLQLFNQGAFYDAHEYFETAWRETLPPEREFYRALLQISGGYYRLTQDNAKAARKFFDHALGWLAAFSNLQFGIDTAVLRLRLTGTITALDQGQSPQTVYKQRFHPIQPQSPQEPK